MPNLILSRKSGESIVIGEHGDIVVTIQSVRGGTVDLRISADASVPVHRDEIFAKINGNTPEAVDEGRVAAVNARAKRPLDRNRLVIRPARTGATK